MTQGYSGTPLARKLSLKPGHRVSFDGMPETVRTLIASQEPDLIHANQSDGTLDMIHLFTTWRADLETGLAKALRSIAQDGMIWISWPKKAAKVPTDITEDTIREVALPMGLVDIKVCAVDAIWSGLKLVIRKQLRT